MKKVLISGGQGDIAQAIVNELNKYQQYDIYAPSSSEFNVLDFEQINSYVKKIKPDILINNAGAIVIESISGDSMNRHKHVIDVTLTGVFNCTNAVIMANKNALIINIGSSAATKSHADWSSYCAAKAGVAMATKCWADEGVNAYCISPGRTVTKMRAAIYPNEDTTTLMKTEDFAIIIYNTILGKFPKGENIDVNVNNVKDMINE